MYQLLQCHCVKRQNRIEPVKVQLLTKCVDYSTKCDILIQYLRTMFKP